MAHAYSLLRTILNSAIDDELISINPCRIRRAGRSKRVKRIEPATLAELEVIAANMPEERRLTVLLAAWCTLRFGEITELRRQDVDLKRARVHIRRGVVSIDGERIVDSPKTEAGARTISIPPHLLPLVQDHRPFHSARPNGASILRPRWPTDRRVDPLGQAGAAATDQGIWVNESATGLCRAREAAGRPDLRFHDLRHTSAVLAAQAGATLAELMNRLGHTTPAAAMIYQHAARDRDAEIARRLSEMVQGSAD